MGGWPCSAWEAVYIIDGLLRNDSEMQPDTIYPDMQGQSLPVFGLAALLGFELLLRRLGNHSHKNRLYRAFRELGRVIRAITRKRPRPGWIWNRECCSRAYPTGRDGGFGLGPDPGDHSQEPTLRLSVKRFETWNGVGAFQQPNGQGR